MSRIRRNFPKRTKKSRICKKKLKDRRIICTMQIVSQQRHVMNFKNRRETMNHWKSNMIRKWLSCSRTRTLSSLCSRWSIIGMSGKQTMMTKAESKLLQAWQAQLRIGWALPQIRAMQALIKINNKIHHRSPKTQTRAKMKTEIVNYLMIII